MVTRKEVAALAGVSESTMTRVLNGGYVSDAVREKVVSVVQELNYHPNALAQGLRTRRTFQIACVVPWIDNPFYSEMVLGVEEAANRFGYVLSMYSSHIVEQNPDRSFFSGRHDGLILLAPRDLDGFLVTELWESHIPMKMYWDWGGSPIHPGVSVDLREGMHEVIRYLVGLGHRRIGYLSHSPQDERENPRLHGIHDGFRESGIAIESRVVQNVIDHGTMDTGYGAMAELYRKFPDVTAVVGGNDLLSLGASRWLQEHGIRVPEDVSLVGCDDIVYSSMSNPPLTTLQIPKREIGNRLVQLLVRQMEDGTSGTDELQVELPTRLIIRSSASNVKP